FLDTLEQRTFAFFWERTDPATGLTPDRWPTPSFSSIAAVGFALTAYPIGAERGYVTRAAAADRVLTTLRFFYGLPQGATPSGTGGNEGFFYHFLDMADGHRFGTVELSTVDTAILLAGALFCQQYFDGADATEAAIRSYADSLYRRANWRWFQPRPPLVGLAWKPEDGFSTYDWRGYSEGSIIYVLALGSPTAAIDSTAWDAWTATYQWGQFYGYEHVGFAPLFGHQYSHVWIDFRGIRDAYMRGRGIDYFENSRRATYAQRAYATANPDGWTGFGPETWGLSASDGPADVVLPVRGAPRRFFTYAARGASFTEVRDDGTVTPTAVGGSIPFAPEIAIPALVAMRERQGTWLFGTYGFFDAFNPTWQWPSTPLTHGRYVAGQGWFDTDYLGIDQGPILAMIANHRTDIVWRYMRRSPYVIRGLRRAGFSGGWLDQAP
ncbi:MAG: glucoamylase family protein, partial [Gemmatimonadales bacterium]|nr:glucoamylase family protein [Gemmatimonadales bacterium]